MADPVVLRRLSEATDPKEALNKELPDLAGLKVIGTKLLVAIFVRSEKDKRTGLYLTTGQLKEDIYQGTVGLVVKLGNGCFKDGVRDGYRYEFHGFRAEIDDWVIFRPGDGKRIQFNGVDCRWLEDVDIDATIDAPEIITYRN